MTIEWRPVRGYVGHYSVSRCGKVRRDGRARGSTVGRILTCKSATNDYLHVDLSKNDRKKRYRIHRLVAVAFIGPAPSGRHVVNHRDGDISNNHSDNLEWVTVRQNNRDAIKRNPRCRSGSSGEKNGRSVLNERQVLVIKSLRGKVGARDLATLCGVSRALIQRIHGGKLWPKSGPKT